MHTLCLALLFSTSSLSFCFVFMLQDRKWATPRFYDEASGNENFSSSTTTFWGVDDAAQVIIIYACMLSNIWNLGSIKISRETTKGKAQSGRSFLCWSTVKQNSNHHIFSNDCIESIHPSLYIFLCSYWLFSVWWWVMHFHFIVTRCCQQYDDDQLSLMMMMRNENASWKREVVVGASELRVNGCNKQ